MVLLYRRGSSGLIPSDPLSQTRVMDLSTGYMGLALRNPLVASPSPLSHTLDGIRQLADGGVGAIVMFSLFEEEMRERAARTYRLVDDPAESFPEALGYFPSVVEGDVGPQSYLDLLERAVSAVDIPVIASLNGITPESWTHYARAMQDAGAAAIELNIYYFPADPEISGPDVEQRHVDVFQRVKAAVTVPVAVKLKPYFSSPGAIALRLDEAGADGLVLFNRFIYPDIDLDRLAVRPMVDLSSPADARVPRTWIALLRGKVRASLAATTGVEVPADLAKYLLAGARRGDDHLRPAAPRTQVRDRTARRPVLLDEAQRLPDGRRAARQAVSAGHYRPRRVRARRLRHSDASRQRGRLCPLVNESAARDDDLEAAKQRARVLSGPELNGSPRPRRRAGPTSRASARWPGNWPWPSPDPAGPATHARGEGRRGGGGRQERETT